MSIRDRVKRLELDHPVVTRAEYEAAIYALIARTHAKLCGEAVLPPEPSARVLEEGRRMWPPDPGAREKLRMLLERQVTARIDAPAHLANKLEAPNEHAH